MSAPRRRFLKSLAAAPLLPAAIAEAQTPAAAQPAPSPAASVAPDPVADALTEVVRLRYGAHFEGTDDLDTVRGEIARNQRSATRLRALGLRNGDEPVTVFSARLPGETPASKRRR